MAAMPITFNYIVADEFVVLRNYRDSKPGRHIVGDRAINDRFPHASARPARRVSVGDLGRPPADVDVSRNKQSNRHSCALVGIGITSPASSNNSLAEILCGSSPVIFRTA